MFELSEAPAMPQGMITADQSRAARALLQWSREDLAAAADVSPSTVKNYEAGKNTITAIAVAIERALTEAGVEFIRPDNGGAGVRWRKAQGGRR
jgi:transcriptional regulator with XRE-family HTH domain